MDVNMDVDVNVDVDVFGTTSLPLLLSIFIVVSHPFLRLLISTPSFSCYVNC